MLTISKKKSIQLGWRLYQKLEEAALLTNTGWNYSVRLAEPADLPLMADLLTGISANTRYLRFLSPVPAFTMERATDQAFKLWLDNSWPTLVLLAVIREGEEEKVVGLGELHINPQAGEEAEFALLVRDELQGQGIGTLLLKRLLALATRSGLSVLQADMLPQNRAMRQVLTKLEMPVSFKYDSGTLGVRVELAGSASAVPA